MSLCADFLPVMRKRNHCKIVLNEEVGVFPDAAPGDVVARIIVIRVSVYVQAKSEKIFSFGVTHYLRCLRQAFFHKSECLLPLGQAQ